MGSAKSKARRATVSVHPIGEESEEEDSPLTPREIKEQNEKKRAHFREVVYGQLLAEIADLETEMDKAIQEMRKYISKEYRKSKQVVEVFTYRFVIHCKQVVHKDVLKMVLIPYFQRVLEDDDEWFFTMYLRETSSFHESANNYSRVVVSNGGKSLFLCTLKLSLNPVERDNSKTCYYHSIKTYEVEEECTICKERPPDLIFYPCGHSCVCSQCQAANQPRMQGGKCPICQGTAISAWFRETKSLNTFLKTLIESP